MNVPGKECLGMWLSWRDVTSGPPDDFPWDTSIACTPGLKPYYYKINESPLWDREFRRNSCLQAAWDISIARTMGLCDLITVSYTHLTLPTIYSV